MDRNKLAQYGFSILDVRDAIDRNNVSRPGGTVTSGPNESIVRFDTRAVQASDVMKYPVAAIDSNGLAVRAGGGGGGGSAGGGMGGMGGGGGGSATGSAVQQPAGPTALVGQATSPRVILIRDVAQVLDTHWERRSAYHYLRHEPGTQGDLMQALEVAVVQNPDASSWKVIKQVKQVLAGIQKDYPGVYFDIAYDNSQFVDILFNNMIVELGSAILLCGLAVFLFLGE